MMHCSLLTTPGIPHQRGMHGDAALMKHACRVDLFDDPCYVNTQALQSTRGYAANQSSIQPHGSTWHIGSKCLPPVCITSILVLWQLDTINYHTLGIWEQQLPVLLIMKVTCPNQAVGSTNSFWCPEQSSQCPCPYVCG